jgi:hypothetical protein
MRGISTLDGCTVFFTPRKPGTKKHQKHHMHRHLRTWLAALTLPFALGLPQADAYTHPCIPHTVADLDAIKGNLDKEPWKTGYAILANASTSQLTYVPNGPWAEVGRTPDVNLTYWKNDMTAVYNLARMWYFTGNDAYAQKARNLLIDWATTHTSFTGQEIPLSIGDFAQAYAGGASILRGTWPGWTEADTTTVKNYFLNVYWPRSLCDGYVTGPANKGYIYQAAGIAIAAFCDDTAKFNHVINTYRTNPAAGLLNTLATGEMGETGRDAGHLYGGLVSAAFLSEVAWSQGIDLYSESDNRLLACAEYYARNTLELDNPFVPFGTIDWIYFANAAGPYTANRGAFYIIQNAYKNRKNLPTPWIDRKLEEQNVDGGNFMYAKSADFTTATMTPASFPAVSLASSGLTLTTLGTQTAGRSASYSNGVWTVTGLGNNVWSDTADDCQFVYQTMTGDCAMVAKLASSQFPSTQAKAGLMIRDTLTGAFSKRVWVGLRPEPSAIKLESHVRGWTDVWGGSNRDDISRSHPPGMPYWFKIERRGDMIHTYCSQDGTSWAATLTGYYAGLPSTLHIGLFVASGSTTTNTATFENVAFTGGTGGLVTTPAAPAAMFATASSKAVTLRWLPSFGATSYDLLRSTTSGSGYTVIASNLTSAKTSYVDGTVSPGTTYYYVAQAKNSAGTSGNSPQFGATLLPTAMVNLAFSGTSTASFNQGSATEGSAKAFDTDPGSKWYGYNAPTGWLQYDFGSSNAQVVKRYTINVADVATRDPKNWNFLGSQDGSTWTTLDSQSNQAFSVRMQIKTYNIANTTAYRYYRLDVTANNGATGLAISELGLWSDTGRTIPDGTYRVVSRKSNKVIDLVNGGTADGTDAIQWGWNGGDDQKWDLSHLGNGQYKLTGVASSKLLEVTGASTSNGAVIQIWPSNNNNCQKWTITPAGDGAFKLVNVNSGKAIDVSGGSTADGAAIIQWPYGGADNQQWRMSTAP